MEDLRSHKRKITAAEVEQMRARDEAGEDRAEILKDYPISRSHFYHVLAYTKR